MVLSSSGEARIPPEAYAEYGFQLGEQVVFLHGSRRSGDCSIAQRKKLARSEVSLAQRKLGEGVIGENEMITFLGVAGFQPGERLLIVRGSGLVLGFVQRSPIHEEASLHPKIEVFST